MINLICAGEPMSAGNIIIWVVLIVALLFMLIFPTFTQKKRNKQYEQMINSIRVGDTVRTSGGIIGRVVRITKKGEITTVTLETGSKSEKSYTEFDINFINCVLQSTRTVEEKPAENAENKGDVSDITPEKAEETVEPSTEEPKAETEEVKKPKAKSAVKKTTKKTAKK